ncbi:hypothetical protein PF005_g13218 [Phytophthora fragariae]|uniref:Uncharacterized protein n=1 Tax=Phytophthora fragariae TaxID=53985 RepID=A0A6A3KBS2_9STRA|nr:hypothetical protein PF003_g6371 [Phytophthora fragariae]KAE8928803.1 hypothetical protein PF009_g21059 [Phytophthora fragariae]KAE9001353.1 hypothetical protein PF011_g13781 [Phytophthora fragariae]KAE9098599.1 hypothetical protein PF010_g15498 [Phytophthora fragariae]KAE9099079.1 hypothetical protein PF007_g16020 [Phytophthora fragariae]
MFAELPQNAEEILEDRMSELVLYFTRIEKAERELGYRDKSKSYKDLHRETSQGHQDVQNNRHKDDKKRSDSEGNTKSDKWCSFHKKCSRNTSDC